MQRLADLVNVVYAESEQGMWNDGAARTSTTEMASMTAAGEIVVATLGRETVGCVRLRRIDETTAEFGVLAADPARRGVGVGRELVRHVERVSAADGVTTMRLEVLVPREWSHPSKEFLIGWYTRIGYRRTGTGRVDEAHPHLAPLLATPCDVAQFAKPLTESSFGAE
ncbi:GNAT family N-acetyltransferase [Amycolatopsis suaedae]|uniref:GNAT family N-acetyltransferase n=2 Tax=Amycolatopsis suaedae TaxID=2510978 RepID=A0A4Q7JF12_9PSEU|nr:GNAT family N-acetyltransferase [Amycolatopsis suaedae]